MSGFGSSYSGPSSSISVAGSIHLESGPSANAPRRSPLSHPAILFSMAVAVLFGAHALGYLPQFGSLLDAAIRSGQNTAVPALGPAFYGIAGLVGFLLLLAVLRSFDMLLRRLQKTSPLASRPLKPLADFLDEAAAVDISVRVARESYHLLLPCYPRLMCIGLADRLRDDLQLRDEEIRLLDAQLLTRCDRRDLSSEATPSDISRLLSVFDLLLHVDTAAPLRMERQSGLRERVTDIARPTSVSEPRHSTSAQRKALHAAALVAIESGSLRSARAEVPQRRNSDYEGPRRRATDNRPRPLAYEGPLRRSTDHAVASPAVLTKRQATTGPGEINHSNPFLVPPLKSPRPNQS